VHGASDYRQRPQRMLVPIDQTPPQRAGPHRPYQPNQTFVTDAALPAGLANICHTRGIEVIEAMPKSSADIDDPACSLLFTGMITAFT